ncbi:DUF2283 domain-containing protein [Synechocystis sp. FACHB-383]|uniref:DUF2283 domain-containing protein n=1 Tax=Synechocystis sp. FACHB-383 TaxID=2692864 RepID=UPI00168663F5|nr:DUF2283 domain-containing protein [Synechocystis sp. FACHB-383]MBD2654337.1 DUF2283 domain-containing protein [Synechocystis sp. FACHB-383]
MKIQYFPETDTLAIELTHNPVSATDVIADDLIVDYDEQGKLVAITIDNYSKNVDEIDLKSFALPLAVA